MGKVEKKIILPLVIFLIGNIFLGITVYNIRISQQKQSRASAKLNAMAYAGRMKTDIMEGINVTDALEQILISEDGKIDKFSKVAENMITDSIQSIQVAPDGIVTDIYPKKGNEAGKIDLMHDKDRGKISCYGRDHHVMVMQGPFELKQGGYGIAVRNPVYLRNAEGKESFWGFTIVIIRVPDIFADSVKALSDFGYEYSLSKTVAPWSMSYKEVYGSGKKLVNPVYYNFEIDGSKWKLEVMPKNGWNKNGLLYVVLGGGILIILLLTGLTRALLVFDEHQKKFKKLAITDGLTGVYNRHGFDEHVKEYMKQNSEKNCIVAQLDVDDFKFINDIYGHASGDKALQNLAETMRNFFSEDVVLGRNGGDEFCIFLPNYNYEEAGEQLIQFTKMKKTFSYEGEEHIYTISLGYAEYPACAKNHAQLMRYADAALYEVKLRGKNGCMVYRDGLRLEIRTQLGFALKDVSENLPGAFIIYKADKEDDEILFANSEMIRLTGCDNMDELFTYTQRSFRNLICKDEQDMVEQSIWKQIGEGHSNDYVHFHLQKKDKTLLQVLDHGRIVENGQYGKIFYVLIMDWRSMQRHYSDKVNFADNKNKQN